ncbi:MAG: hypothetical protein K9M98_00485 [Cephaloticoccus sp.]|nr:hypothetical protein [Cephaloticoccus sp.]MCF7758954.1 hypothetical protein [Cephaloticoccus sp.]
MEWILDHLQILIAAGAAVAYWLNQRQQSKAEGEAEQGPDPTWHDDNPAAAEEAERARRIREEIRRKIAERAQGQGPTPAQVPPPLFRREEPKPLPRFETAAQNRDDGSGYMIAEDNAVLLRQRKIQEQLQALQDTPKVVKHASMTTKMVPPATGISASLRQDLRRGGSLRRAIVLREVLGPPVAMR